MHEEGRRAGEQLAARIAALGRSPEPVDWVLVCGSGMGAGVLAPRDRGGLGLVEELRIDWTELGMPAPSVAGHGASLVFGHLDGPRGRRRVCVQSGRIHPYEGHSAGVCTAVLGAVLRRQLAATHAGVVLTCAVGSLDPSLAVGELVSLRDHIALFAPSPLTGACFVGMSEAYDARLRASVARQSAGTSPTGTPLREAVYAYARGPQYETPAEVEALRALGGTVVGMSTTYEATLAAAHGVPACAVATVTNVAGAAGLSHDEVQVAADQARHRLGALLVGMLGEEPPPRRPGLLAEDPG